jgi:hypothetical protein
MKSPHAPKTQKKALRGEGPIDLAYDLTSGDAGYALSSLGSSALRRFSNLDAAPHAFDTARDVLAWAAAMMGESPAGDALLRHAGESGWKVSLSDTASSEYELVTDEKMFVLSSAGLTPSALGRSAFFRHGFLISFIKGLRDIWQENAHGANIAAYRPDALLMISRAGAADRVVVAILTAWELRAAGYADVWRHMLGGDDGDMAMMFTRALERDPSAIYSGAALYMAFSQWYGDDARIDSCDHDMLESFDGELEDGQTYGHKAIDTGIIEALSLLPGGLAYLSGRGDEIAFSPDFVSLTDPINEAHLFQIIYDTKVVMAGGVPFRDSKLARKIFPGL